MMEQLEGKRDGNESSVGWQQSNKRQVGLNSSPSTKDVFWLLLQFEGQTHVKEAQINITVVVNKGMYKLHCLGSNYYFKVWNRKHWPALPTEQSHQTLLSFVLKQSTMQLSSPKKIEEPLQILCQVEFSFSIMGQSHCQFSIHIVHAYCVWNHFFFPE